MLTPLSGFLDFFPTLWRLFLNPLYNLEVTASCFGVYYAAGWAGYLPKYFEDQFLLGANLASVLAGMRSFLSIIMCQRKLFAIQLFLFFYAYIVLFTRVIIPMSKYLCYIIICCRCSAGCYCRTHYLSEWIFVLEV